MGIKPGTIMPVYEGERLIRVKSWVPRLSSHGIEWPTVLVETRTGTRETRTRIRGLWRLTQCPICSGETE